MKRKLGSFYDFGIHIFIEQSWHRCRLCRHSIHGRVSCGASGFSIGTPGCPKPVGSAPVQFIVCSHSLGTQMLSN